jgi:hypothetical protein
MFKLYYKYKKIKWFKDYKEKVLNSQHCYYNKSLMEIFDLDSNMDLYSVSIYDVVNNNDVNKLVKKIYQLKRNKNYSVEISYKKKFIKDINYIRPEFDHTGHGIFAKIKFLNDSLISYIDMTWSQINNEEAIIEYEIHLKKRIDSFSIIHDYILENYKKLRKIKYSIFYFNIENFLNDDSQNIQTEFKYFRTILQQKISKVSTSNYSKKYLLPIKFTYLIKNKTKKIMKYIEKPFLEESFIVDKDHYLILNTIEEFEGIEINEVIFKKRFNPINMVVMMSELKMPLYYRFFYNIEKQELEYKIGKYLNSKKIFVNIWNYKWLLNKKRRLDEKRFYNINNKRSKSINGFSNKKISLIDELLIKNIGDVYSENIEYINNLNTINYNTIAFAISVLALIIAIVAIFI